MVREGQRETASRKPQQKRSLRDRLGWVEPLGGLVRVLGGRGRAREYGGGVAVAGTLAGRKDGETGRKGGW